MSEEEIGDMMDILELINENEEKDKEIARLNNIIDELEKYFQDRYNNGFEKYYIEDILIFIKELKEGVNNENNNVRIIRND